jgi:hypothetical protein
MQASEMKWMQASKCKKVNIIRRVQPCDPINWFKEESASYWMQTSECKEMNITKWRQPSECNQPSDCNQVNATKLKSSIEPSSFNQVNTTNLKSNVFPTVLPVNRAISLITQGKGREISGCGHSHQIFSNMQVMWNITIQEQLSEYMLYGLY